MSVPYSTYNNPTGLKKDGPVPQGGGQPTTTNYGAGARGTQTTVGRATVTNYPHRGPQTQIQNQGSSVNNNDNKYGSGLGSGQISHSSYSSNHSSHSNSNSRDSRDNARDVRDSRDNSRDYQNRNSRSRSRSPAPRGRDGGRDRGGDRARGRSR